MDMPDTRSDLLPIRLLISDRSRLDCQLLERSFSSEKHKIEVVASATNGEEILSLSRELAPNVALISASLEDGPVAGYKVLPSFLSQLPECAVIMVLDHWDRELIINAFRVRARGVFFRADPFESLVKCVKVVSKGQIWAGTRELQLIIQTFADSTPFQMPSPKELCFTKREKEIALLVAAGNTNRQISRRLNLSEHTVKNYLFRIFEKVGVASRVELAVYLMNQNNQNYDARPKPPLEMCANGSGLQSA